MEGAVFDKNKAKAGTYRVSCRIPAMTEEAGKAVAAFYGKVFAEHQGRSPKKMDVAAGGLFD